MRFVLPVLSLLFWVKLSSQNTNIPCRIIDSTANYLNTHLAGCTKKADLNGQRVLYTCGKYSVIKVNTSDNTFIKQVSWYFKNDSLFYTEQRWTTQDNAQQINYERCYLAKQLLIKWIGANAQPVLENSPAFKEMNDKLPSYAYGLLQQLKK